jgi:hypothetical protein
MQEYQNQFKPKSVQFWWGRLASPLIFTHQIFQVSFMESKQYLAGISFVKQDDRYKGILNKKQEYKWPDQPIVKVGTVIYSYGK